MKFDAIPQTWRNIFQDFLDKYNFYHIIYIDDMEKIILVYILYITDGSKFRVLLKLQD